MKFSSGSGSCRTPSTHRPLSTADKGARMAFFSQDQLEAIAAALGDTTHGLTASEIQHLLASSKMTDPGPITKRIRIFNAFVESQNTKRNRANVLEFIRLAMKPARY